MAKAESGVTYKVKVNPELFDEMKAMRHRALAAASIVQNSMEITHEQLVEWNTLIKDFVGDIKAWREKVVKHIEDCNNE